MMIKVAPSIIAGDMARLGDELASIEGSGADMVHLDVMDGVFVPNITFGPSTVAALRKTSKLIFDTHLMLVDPARYVDKFIKAGSNRISFHVEAQSPVKDLLEYIKMQNVHPGLAINPETPLSAILPYLRYCDFVLVMSVHPGFSGQKFIPSALDKAKKLSNIIQEEGLAITIEMDGGIGPDNIRAVASAGVTEVVAGSAVMRANDRALAIKRLKLVSGA